MSNPSSPPAHHDNIVVLDGCSWADYQLDRESTSQAMREYRQALAV